MNGRLDFTELFFSSAGRLPRGLFMVAAAVLFGLFVLFKAVASPPVELILGWVVYPFLLYCGACITSKRLHDRGRSGWWAALVLLAIVAVVTPPQSYPDFLFSLVLLWAAVELCAMPGEQGLNRFGPNPLRPAAA